MTDRRDDSSQPAPTSERRPSLASVRHRAGVGKAILDFDRRQSPQRPGKQPPKGVHAALLAFVTTEEKR